MNKIYRTVYNETTNTWVAVEETAKSHRKSSGGVVDSTPTSACERVSGSLKLRGLTAAVAIALLSPLAVSPAFAGDGHNWNLWISSATNGVTATGESKPLSGTSDVQAVVDKDKQGAMAIQAAQTYDAGGFSWQTGVSNAKWATAWGLGSAGSTPISAIKNQLLDQADYLDVDGLNTRQLKSAINNATSIDDIKAIFNGKKIDIYDDSDNIVATYNDADGIFNHFGFIEFKEFGVGGKGEYATAWGKNTIAGNNQATAFGSDNKAYGVNSSILGGEGNAIGKFDADGNLTAEDGGGTNGVILGGSGNKVSGENAVASGSNTVASGENSFASGSNTVAQGDNSFAIGSGSQALADNSFAALGGKVEENAHGGFALGEGALVKEEGGIAMGQGAISTAKNAIAIGSDSFAYLENSISFGSNGAASIAVPVTNAIIKTSDGNTVTYGWNDKLAVSEDGYTFSIASEKDGTRQIQDVAAGRITEDSTDAINGGQLYGILQDLNDKQVREVLSADNRAVITAKYDNHTEVVSPLINVQGLNDYKAEDLALTTFATEEEYEADLNNKITDLETKIGSLNTQIDKFNADATTYTGKSTEASNKDTDLQSAMETAKTAMQTAKDAWEDTRQQDASGNLDNGDSEKLVAYKQAESEYKDANTNYNANNKAITFWKEQAKLATENAKSLTENKTSLEAEKTALEGKVANATTDYENAQKIKENFAQATGENAIAMGKKAKAANNSGVAIGTNATVEKVGAGIYSGGVAIGANTTAYGSGAVAIGGTANVSYGVALGYGSLVDGEYDKGKTGSNPLNADFDANSSTWTSTLAAVSVGADKTKKDGEDIPEQTRQIVHVAAGTNDTDAVNVAQLKKYTETTPVTPKDGVATYDDTNTYKDDEGKPLTITYANGDTYTGPVSKVGDTYQDADGKPLTVKDEQGNTYTGDVNHINNSNKFVTASDVVNTINEVYWNVSGKNSETVATGNAKGDNSNIHAGDSVALVAGKGLKLDQAQLNFDNNGNQVVYDDADKKWYQVGQDGNADKSKEVEKANVKSEATTQFIFSADISDLPQQPVVYTDNDGNKLTKNDAGKWVKPKVDNNGDPVLDSNGNPTYEEVENADVIASMNNGGDSTTNPMALSNIQSNLAPTTSDKDGKLITVDVNGNVINTTTTSDTKPTTSQTGPDQSQAMKMNNNAATVGDVLNAGWNLQGNGQAVDFVKPYDTVNFVNGDGTTAKVTSDGLISKVTYDVKVDGKTIQTIGSGSGVDNEGNPVAKADDGEWYPVDGDGKPDTTKHKVNAGDVNEQTVVAAKTTPLAMEEKDSKPTGKVVRPSDTNALATAANVADAINQSGWKVKGSGNSNDNSKFSTELINPGEEVELIAGDGVKLDQNTNQFTFSVNKASNPTYTNTDNKTDGNVYGGQNNQYWDSKQVQDAINNSGFNVIASATTGGTNGSSTPTSTLVKTGEQVEFVAGNNVSIEQDGKKFTFSVTQDGNDNSKTKLTSEQTKSPTTGTDEQYGSYTDGNIQLALKHDNSTDTDTFDVKLNNNVTLGDGEEAGSLNVSDKKEGDKVANTEIKPNVINFTDGDKNNTGAITGLANNLPDDNHNKTSVNAGTYPTENLNNAATYSDVLNAGWNLQADGKAVDFVTHGDTVNFASSDKSVTISGTAGSTIDFKVNKAESHTANNDGSISAPTATADSDGNKPTQFWDATQTANAINSAGWRAKTNGTSTNLNNSDDQKVTAGDLVEFNQGQGIRIEQDAGKFTFAANVSGVTTGDDGKVNAITYYDGNSYVTKGISGDGDTITTVAAGDNNVSVENDGNHNYTVALNNVLNVGNENNGDKPITINGNTGDITLGGNDGGNINNVALHINPDGSRVDPKAPTNQAASVQDLLNVNNLVTGGQDKVDIITYNVEGRTEHHNQNVVDAINAMNEQGIQFFHTNQTGVTLQKDHENEIDSSAGGAYATAIGVQADAPAAESLAFGHRAIAGDEYAIAIGSNAQALGNKSISIGTGNIVRGARSGAIGDPTVIDGSDSYSVGNNNTISTNNTFAFGNDITKTTNNSVFLGDKSAYVAAGDSTAGLDTYDRETIRGKTYEYAGGTPAGVVSVGDVGQERRIQNVAAGKISASSTDAINGSQLYALQDTVNNLQAGTGGIVQYSDADGNIGGDIYPNNATIVSNDANGGPVTIHNVGAGRAPNDAVNVSQLGSVANQLSNKIDAVSDDASAGTASAIATASLPQVYLPGKSGMAAGGGTYRGQTGYAVSFSSISDNGSWVVKGTATGNSQGHYGAGVGVLYQW
ncbi:MAG: YadA-like family protein [Cardiobacteriaceae bacterium]|nr:YadA-like family protein [Cardiobacteriaceae bacterium]